MDERIDRLNRADYEHRLMIKAVWYYYIENYTQQNISHLLGVSRSKVIALLERARQSGVIQFNVQQDSGRRMEMERELLSRFSLRDAFIVPSAGTLANPNESIAQAAAMYILRRAADDAFINMGYGDTTSRILNHLATAAQIPLNVVSLAGGVNYYLPNTNSNVFNARLYLIPSPLLLSSGSLRDSLRREPDVEEIFRMIPLSSMSVVGIGCLNDRATIVKNGILNHNDFTFLKMQGAVGDVLSHFLDRNGEIVSHDLEGRLMSTPMSQLKTLDNVIGAAGGPDKAEAILAVLRGGYLDVLITDEDTAQLLLEAPNS
ncbi:MAG: sugar-binding transcriptional regulator [Oscillospiraceae bacterium]|nr:sugar-binding transcriptional regulator [Oscillospiraceae bacterium]